MERLSISSFLQMFSKGLLLDVRSPAEYAHAHIPGAVSLPLFSDEERKVVGTTYKQNSREQAIKVGLDYFGPRMRAMVEEVENLLEAQKEKQKISEGLSKTVFVYCWRGGMRSGAVAWLLNLYGFKVYVLNGGYKSFRRWAMETYAQPYYLNVIGGYTGSGKTEILTELARRGELVINLEALAQHKGSAFGNIGLPPQPSQEMFENLLSWDIRNQLQAHGLWSEESNAPLQPESHPFWIEDESQRIGLVNIPTPFWDTMRRSPVYFLEIPFEERLQHLVAEYGCLDRERMIGAIERITKRLGFAEAKNAIDHLQTGNTAESFRILLKYYDKHYEKGLHNRENLSTRLNKLTAPGVTAENAALFLSKPISA